LSINQCKTERVARLIGVAAAGDASHNIFSFSMSLKDELKLWQAARNAFDTGDYEKSLELFGVRRGFADLSTVR
jgi:hypothetical protein